MITNEHPFEHFGIGCNTSLGQEPRLGWRRLPLRGNSFDLTLRRAEPNGLAAFWLGVSDAQWAGLALPYDATPLGAPGCALYVSADAPYFAPVDQGGNASLTLGVPLTPALAGLELFSQSICSTTGNAFGFAASGALAIRLR